MFNSLISTTFILVILSFDKIGTFQIWNFEKQQVRTKIWDPNWFQHKMWWIPKLFNSWISTTFILVISSFDKFLAHIVRCVTFVNNVIITLSYEKMINTKVVDLDELFNFGIYYLFSWNHLGYQNLVWSCIFLKFKI